MSVVLQLTEKLKGLNCAWFFDNFVNIPSFFENIVARTSYTVGTVRGNIKLISSIESDKEISKGEGC